jgi:cytoskeletal protein RodZ
MYFLFAVLGLLSVLLVALSLLALVGSMIAPKFFSKIFKRELSRKQLSLIFSGSTIVWIVAVVVLGVNTPKASSPSPDSTQTPVQQVATTTDMANEPTTTPTPVKPAPSAPIKKIQISPTPQPSAQTPRPTLTPTAATPKTQTLLDVSGSGTKTTEDFTASGNWNLNWSYDCSSFGYGQGNFQVMVYNADGSPSFENTPVNELGKSGSDTEYYHTGGTFYLVVNSECIWNIQAQS